jgi:hypothetical protein
MSKSDNPSKPATPVAAFAGKSIALTGTFTTMKRADAQKVLVEAGAKLSSGVTKKTDLLIHGDNAGSKLDKAASLGVAVMTVALHRGRVWRWLPSHPAGHGLDALHWRRRPLHGVRRRPRGAAARRDHGRRGTWLVRDKSKPRTKDGRDAVSIIFASAAEGADGISAAGSIAAYLRAAIAHGFCYYWPRCFKTHAYVSYADQEQALERFRAVPEAGR